MCDILYILYCTVHLLKLYKDISKVPNHVIIIKCYEDIAKVPYNVIIIYTVLYEDDAKVPNHDITVSFILL